MTYPVDTLDTRARAGPTPQPRRPSVARGERYTDPDFTQKKAMAGVDTEVEWLRPQHFAPAPSLFTEGSTSYDVKQGSAGTCWFLSVLAPLGDQPERLKHIIPDDNVAMDSPSYDGVFHSRFYSNGEWHDVYCDDYVPVRKTPEHPEGRPWGARAEDVNEMWVALTEKAFAKFHGGYTKIYGGWAGNSFVALTGGVAETVPVADLPPPQLYDRVANALQSRCVVAGSVPPEKKGYEGLVGGHTYSITAVYKVGEGKDQKSLVRIRNPWGKETGQWTGAWSRDSREWGSLSAETRRRLEEISQGNGEFWMDIRDYVKCFRDTHFCCVTPDFDGDGTTDGLELRYQIFGEWSGKSAAGSKMKLKNPKYAIEIGDSGTAKDGLVPVVIQFSQIQEDSFDDNYTHVKADLYKFGQQYESDSGPVKLLEELTTYTSYYRGPTYLYRYRLTPGRHLLLPSTADPGQHKQFFIRMFCASRVTAEPMDDLPPVILKKSPAQFEYNKNIHKLGSASHHFLEWKGQTAGGQPKNGHFASNPQVKIQLTGGGSIPVGIDLAQEGVEPILPLGIKLYQVPKGQKLPLDDSFLSKGSLPPVTGKDIFIRGDKVQVNYILKAGLYTAVVFTDKQGDQKRLCFSVSPGRGAKAECSNLPSAAGGRAPPKQPAARAPPGGRRAPPGGGRPTAKPTARGGNTSMTGALGAMADLMDDYANL